MIGGLVEQRGGTGADEVAVVREHQPQPHAASVGRAGATRQSLREARAPAQAAQAIQPPSTNSTEPTAIQAAMPGSWVSWYISQPMMTVEGMVMTQAATISITTPRLTPLAGGHAGAGD